MLHAVQQIESTSKILRYHYREGSGVDKTQLQNRATAMKWLDGGVGLVTFEDCCEAMGVLPQKAREKILARAHERRRNPDLTRVRETWS